MELSQSGRETASNIEPPTPNSIDREEIGSKVFDVEEANPINNQEDSIETNELAAMLIEQSPKFEEAIEDHEVEPSKFNQAWNHPNERKRNKWRDAINKEFNDMNDRKVWLVIDRNKMPPNRRCVKSKWVFKIKRNGIYRARLVACGYSQIPGIDFSEISYSPVINDVTYRIMLLLSMLYNYANVIIDIETAFLHGELEKMKKYTWNVHLE